MAYCRFSDGDVYLYMHVGGFFECCACSLAPMKNTIVTSGFKGFAKCEECEGKGCKECWCKECKGKGCNACQMHGNNTFKKRSEAIAHLKEHIKAGHDVPDYAIEQLEEEIKEEGDEWNE